MRRPAIALLIGIPSPDPIKDHLGIVHRFEPLDGVRGDIEAFSEILNSDFRPAGGIYIETLTEPRHTTRRYILNTCTRLVKDELDPHGLFILYVSAHGFQISDANNDEEGEGDKSFDEVLAATGGEGIADDDFARLWAQVPESVNVVAIADTCSADTVLMHAIAPEIPLEAQLPTERTPVFTLDETVSATRLGPSRIFLAAAAQGEVAEEEKRKGSYRGVLSVALQEAWYDTKSRTSYQMWFTRATELVRGPYPQHPVIRYLGPNRDLFGAPPLQHPLSADYPSPVRPADSSAAE